MRRTLITIAGLAMVVAACTEAAPVEQPNTTAPEATIAVAATTAIPTTTTTTEPPSTTTEAVPEGSEVTISFVLDENTDTGTFTVAGPAVDEGLICVGGTTLEVLWEQGAGSREISHVEYTCEDGTGTFKMESEYQGEVKGDGTVKEWGTWIIWEGTGSGAYEQLSGSGTMNGIIRFREGDTLLTGPSDASETFTGHLSINS